MSNIRPISDLKKYGSFEYGCGWISCLSYKEGSRLFYHYGYGRTGAAAGESTEV